MGADEAAAARLRRHPFAPAPSSRLRSLRFRICRCIGCHGAADFESLVEIVRETGSPLPAVAKIDEVLAGQAADYEPECTKAGCDRVNS